MNMYVSLHLSFFVCDIPCLAEHGLLHPLSQRTTRRPSECTHKCWDNHLCHRMHIHAYKHTFRFTHARARTHTCKSRTSTPVCTQPVY